VRPLAERAGQGQHRTPVPLGAAGHPRRDLAARGLVAEGALGGDDQVGAGQPGVQVEVAEEDVEPGRQPGAERGEARAQAAGGAGAGAGAQIGVRDPEVAGQDVRPVLQAGGQMFHLRGCRALLRAEDAGHTALAAQHVERVAGDQQFGPGEAGAEAGRLDPVQAEQLPAAGRELEAAGVQQPGAERPEGARAAVRGAGVAAADEAPRGAVRMSAG